MQVIRASQLDRTEKLTKLGDVKPGDGKVVRFQGTFFEDALCGKDDACFYMVIKSTPEKAGRVTICSLDGKAVLEIDVDHLVIVHSAKVVVDDAEMI